MEEPQRTGYYKQHLCIGIFMIRFCIVLVSVVCSLLIPKDAQPVAASLEIDDIVCITPSIKIELLKWAPVLPIDLSFLDNEVNPKQFQVEIAPNKIMSIKLLTPLIDKEVRENSVTVPDLYHALNRTNPKRVHDIAMLLLKKLYETNWASTDPEVGFRLMQYSERVIQEIEVNLNKDYVALFQAYMYGAVVHNKLGDKWFAMYCRKAFNLAEAHEDLERKDLVTQFVIQTQLLCRSVGKIERILRQNAIQCQDHRFWNHIRVALKPQVYTYTHFSPPYNRDCVSDVAGADVADTHLQSLPTYEEAKKAMGLDTKTH